MSKKRCIHSVFAVTLTVAFLFYSSCSRNDSNDSAREEIDSLADYQSGRGPGKGMRRGSKGKGGGRFREQRIEVDLKNQSIRFDDEVKRQIDVKTIVASQAPIQATLKAMGKALAPPEQIAKVSTPYPARISDIRVRIGDWVQKNQVLLLLESIEVGDAKADYAKAFTEFQLKQKTKLREERLFNQDIGAEKDYLESKADFQIAQSNLNTAAKKHQLFGFSLAQIDEFADSKNINPYITVRAPLSGRVVETNAILGTMTDPSVEIMTIMDLTALCVDAEIFEKDLSKIGLNQEVNIAVPAYPNEIFRGTIHFIGDLVNEDTRTITVRSRVKNGDFKLKPGMFADITILLDRRDSALILPIQAVLDDGDKKIVFVQKDDRFYYREISTGILFNGSIEILAGLKAGDIVVTEGHYQLKSKLQERRLQSSHTH